MRRLLILGAVAAACSGSPMAPTTPDTGPTAGFCEMFGDCATARLTLPDGIPRGHCAYNPAFDHDNNGRTCEPGRNHPVP